MHKDKKRDFCESLADHVARSKMVFIVSFDSLDFKKISDMRRNCKKSGMKLQVVKKSLLRRVVDIDDEKSVAKSSVMLVTGDNDESIFSAVKIFAGCARKGYCTVAKAFEDGQIIPRHSLRRLETVNSLVGIYGELVSVLQRGPCVLCATLQQVVANFIFVCDMRAKNV